MQLASNIKNQFTGIITTINIEPSEIVGSFEIMIGEDLIFSKMNIGRLPQPGEVEKLLMTRINK